MRVFLITAFVALTVAKPDIGLLLRQQLQITTGYSKSLWSQLYQQQHTFTDNHNENPSQITQTKSEVFFIKYETQQEADANYARAPKRENPINQNNEYLPPIQQQQGYYYQPQHHQQLNQQYNNQQQQTFTPNTQDKNVPVEGAAPGIHSLAQPPYRVKSNKNSVAYTYAPNSGYSSSIQVNQNNLQGIENNEALKPCFSSNNEYLPWFYHQNV